MANRDSWALVSCLTADIIADSKKISVNLTKIPSNQLLSDIMGILNVEIKARCSYPEKIREVLHQNNARFKGKDHQIDTYFKIEKGRLKLREGNIENSLIYYQRENQKGPKQSHIQLYRSQKDDGLKEVLLNALEILAVVDKQREIYFVDNIKFHIDQVKGLGSFVEIEAIDETGEIGWEKLNRQCDRFIHLFGIKPDDLQSESYSDMILNN